MDGVQDAGEPGILGAMITLYDLTADTILSTAVTDDSGFYEFTGLPAGTYAVEFSLPSGYNFTSPNQGSDDGLDSDADTSTGQTPAISVSAGEHHAQADAGMFIPNAAPASIGDFVWNDENQNGIQDEGEPGIPGVTVNLYDSMGTALLASVLTDEDGLYEFPGLVPGGYVIEFDLPSQRAQFPRRCGHVHAGKHRRFCMA